MADEIGVRTEAAAPEIFAHNGHRRCALLAIRGEQRAACERLCVQQRKYFRRDCRGVDNRRLACSGQREIVKCISGHFAEDAVLRAAFEEVPVGYRRQCVWLFLRGIEHKNELFGMGIRERTQKHRVHDTENRRVGADAKGQRQDDDGGEARALAQRPQAIT